uniref:Uncharacterized protein n=1 Tax=Ananas comosus var. bracteatus TaxID=296719 RepID=A0A6V7PZM6_ANACO|nr:unnamed protein product [Ananas comosus var. bracteatus]
MPNSDVGGDGGAEPGSNSGSSNPGSKVVVDPLRLGEKGGVGGLPTLSIVISQPEEAPSPKGDVAKGGGAVEGDEKVVGSASAAAARRKRVACRGRRATMSNAEFVSKRQKSLWSILGADAEVSLQKHTAPVSMFGSVLKARISVRYANRWLRTSPFRNHKLV